MEGQSTSNEIRALRLPSLYEVLKEWRKKLAPQRGACFYLSGKLDDPVHGLRTWEFIKFT